MKTKKEVKSIQTNFDFDFDFHFDFHFSVTLPAEF